MKEHNGRKTPHLYRFPIVIERDEDGIYVASCPVLQGCHTQGDTFEKAFKNIKEVIHLCLEELQEGKKPIPQEASNLIALTTVEVTI